MLPFGFQRSASPRWLWWGHLNSNHKVQDERTISHAGPDRLGDHSIDRPGRRLAAMARPQPRWNFQGNRRVQIVAQRRPEAAVEKQRNWRRLLDALHRRGPRLPDGRQG